MDPEKRKTPARMAGVYTVFWDRVFAAVAVVVSSVWRLPGAAEGAKFTDHLLGHGGWEATKNTPHPVRDGEQGDQ